MGIDVNPGDGGSSSGGSSSSSSSSSSSTSSTPSAPPAPPTDTYISDTYKTDAVKRTKEQMFAQIYMQLWGEPATEAYLMHAVDAGLNSVEFAAHERNKPEWAQTKAYQDQAKSLADALANIGV